MEDFPKESTTESDHEEDLDMMHRQEAAHQICWGSGDCNTTIRQVRQLCDRTNPLVMFSDTEFWLYFRFTKENFLKVMDLIVDDLQFGNNRGNNRTPLQQVSLALSFYATRTFQGVVGYLVGAKTSCSCDTSSCDQCHLCQIPQVNQTSMLRRSAEISKETLHEIWNPKYCSWSWWDTNQAWQQTQSLRHASWITCPRFLVPQAILKFELSSDW